MKCIAALTAFTLAFPAFLTRGQGNSGPDHAMSHDMHHMSSTNSMDTTTKVATVVTANFSVQTC